MYSDLVCNLYIINEELFVKYADEVMSFCIVFWCSLQSLHQFWIIGCIYVLIKLCSYALCSDAIMESSPRALYSGPIHLILVRKLLTFFHILCSMVSGIIQCIPILLFNWHLYFWIFMKLSLRLCRLHSSKPYQANKVCSQVKTAVAFFTNAMSLFLLWSCETTFSKYVILLEIFFS